MLEKVGQDKVAEVLTEAAAVITELTSERDALAEKVASMELHQRCEKLASVMEKKGIATDPHDYTVGNLEKMAAQGKLDELERAVNLVGPDMGAKLGHAAHTPNSDQAQGGTSQLETFLLGT